MYYSCGPGCFRREPRSDSSSSVFFLNLFQIAWVEVLRPIPHKKCQFRDALPSQSLGIVLKKLNLTLLLLLLRPFSCLSSRTTWVSGHQKGKPFRILLEQVMMGWQWHQLDHMQIICTSLQTDNHARQYLTTQFYRPDALPATQPTASKHWNLKALNLTQQLR